MRNPMKLPIFVVAVCLSAFWLLTTACSPTPRQPKPPTPKQTEDSKSSKLAGEQWAKDKLVIPGTYADADVVDIGDGKLRMYYSLEPEAPGFEGQVYSAVSSDGKKWVQEEGIRMKQATFPSVVQLPNGNWRMYFQGSASQDVSQKGVMSAISSDGLNWTIEDGFRIKVGQEGEHDTENVAAPTVARLDDDSYLMVYRGSAGENSFGKMDNFSGKPVPIDYLISATSKDGLSWDIKEVVVDSRNNEMRDQIDGPELFEADGKIKLYCNSYSGVYLLTLDKQGKPLSSPKMVMKAGGPDDAPCDVALVDANGKVRMYFGMHTKGIFSAKRTDY